MQPLPLRHSAKLHHQQQNRDAYRQAIPNPLLPAEPHVDLDIPLSLHRRAAYKIRSTPQFTEAYHGLSLPTVTLYIWEPRYQPIVSPETTIHDGSDSLLNVLHSTNGHQLRLLEEQGHERRKLSVDDISNRNLVGGMLEEIDMRLATWILHDNEFEQFEGPEWETMTSELALEWGAKIIYCLRDEVRVRQLGRNYYLEAYKGERLAWQSIDVIGQ
jgi:hypothetical protein